MGVDPTGNGRGDPRAGEDRDLSSEQIAFEVRRNIAAGVCCIPLIKKDQPAVAWKEFQERFPTDSEIDQWLSEGRWHGVGAVCGKVSGGLQALDFDLDASIIFAQYVRMVEDHRPGLIARIPIFRTPKGGYHLPFRCEAVGKAEKLALRAVEAPEKTQRSRLVDGKHIELWELIETRAEGNYLTVWPSRRSVHPSGKPYTRERGSLLELPTITPDERDVLFGLARFFNEYVEPERERPQYTEMRRAEGGAAGLRPGSDFNQRGADAVEGLLLEAGWTIARRVGAGLYLRRPGKREGHSATLHIVAPGILYCFSGTEDHFERDHGYKPFEIYTRLKHNGDHSAAAKALAELGYGEQPQKAPGETSGGGATVAADCSQTSALMNQIIGLMLTQWEFSDEDKVTFFAMHGLSSGWATFRRNNETVAAHIRKYEGNEAPGTRFKERQFARRRLDSLFSALGEIDYPILTIIKKGGEVNRATGKRSATRYGIDMRPFKEALQLARTHSDFKKAPGRACEWAALEVAARYKNTGEEGESESAGKGNQPDAFTRELKAEKALWSTAKKLVSAWEEQDLTLAEKRIRGSKLMEHFAELLYTRNLGKRRRKSKEIQGFASAVLESTGIMHDTRSTETEKPEDSRTLFESENMIGYAQKSDVVDALLEDDAERF